MKSSIINARLAHQYEGHKGSIYCLENGPEPELFYSGSFDNWVVEWSLKDPEQNRAIAKLPAKAFALKYIPEKQLLLIGNYNGGVHVVDLKENKEIKLLQYHQKIIFDIQYLPSKDCFFVLAADGSFSVWSLSDFSLIVAKNLGTFKLRSIDFNTDTNELVVGCGDGAIRVFDIEKLEEKSCLQVHDQNFSVNVVKFYPNQEFLLTGSRDAHLNVIDVNKNYEVVQRIPAHNYAIYSIVFSPDQKLFATASMDKTVKIWDANQCELLLRISNTKHQGHTNSVNKLLWSGFNNKLISTGDDRTIKVWDLD
eukprot:TRINITY_DN71662_c0_g1_i1.p1 TRINITY_DN71662_c0_g1~~TRINITY_DN71662_c0_g1_i1.p1  ORF type:complete len:309 (+),score=-38.08 TRINITY_DN71662_c0_g1_i1:101-1027(+)